MTVRIVEGHVVLTTLAGRASLSVHRKVDGLCEPICSVMLEPSDVLDLATRLTQASVPAPPVVQQRIEVRRDDDALALWRFECPECFPVAGRFMGQPDALAAAYRHLEVEHASERGLSRNQAGGDRG